MKAPLSWLKDYVDIDVSAEELQAKLFSCGFEVEELYELGKDVSGVVVGEVIECEKVEGTHLSVCKVDCGSKGVFQICCGADNVKVGIKAPCALAGATVYATAKDHVTVEGVVTIKKGKLRGIESEGMLCSGVELGVNGDMYEGADYNGLLILPNALQNGDDVKHELGLDDYIFDIAITANRPDCQSIYGIAREVAAVLGKKIKEPDCSYKAVKGNKEIEITNSAPELCFRYIGHYVKDVKTAPSPAWLKKKLALCGLRSINNVVDITNFVLLELGQPMHAFDLRTLAGGTVHIRRAKKDEKIVTLDKNEFKLNEENLVICDSEKPCALAGIMGGLNSEIKDDTTEVLFESAKFARDNVRRTARALGQHSDSSALFEKGVNEYTVEMAIERALHLMDKLGCGKVTDVHIDVTTAYSNLKEKQLTVSIKKINALLGITVPTEEMQKILKNLNFKVETNGDEMLITVPRYREDIDGYPDIAEEIIRMYGYGHIVPTFIPTASVTSGGFTKEQKTENKIKDLLVSKGLFEISSYSFISEKDFDILNFPSDCAERKAIKILNPISEDLSVMRTTLAPSMVNVIVRNLRRGNLNGRLFELAKIYAANEIPVKNFPNEMKMLSLGMWGNCTFFHLKGIIESLAEHLNIEFEYKPSEKPFLHPGKTAKIICHGEDIGYFGILAPTVSESLAIDRIVAIGEIDYGKLITLAKPFRYNPLPKFTEFTRDLALVCDCSINSGEIEKEIYSACKYVSDVHLFDIYAGEQIGKDKKSMAYSVTFTPKDEPIDDKIDGFVKKILNNLKFKLNITLR